MYASAEAEIFVNYAEFYNMNADNKIILILGINTILCL
jgi:hypothetical protein